MADPNSDGEKKAGFSLSDLPVQIRAFWAATGIPIVELMVSLIVLTWCAGINIDTINHVTSLSSAHVQTIRPMSTLPISATIVENQEKAGDSKGPVDLYGLRTILPLAALVVILGVAQGLSAFMRMLGGTLPLHIVYRVEVLLADYLPLDTLASAWARCETINNLSLLSAQIDQEVDRSARNIKSTPYFSRSLELKQAAESPDSVRKFVAGLFLAGLSVWAIRALTFSTRTNTKFSATLTESEMSIVYEFLAFVIVSIAILAYLNVSYLRATRLYHYRKFADFVRWQDAEFKIAPSEKRNFERSRLGSTTRLKETRETQAKAHNLDLITNVRGNTDLEFDLTAWQGKWSETKERRTKEIAELEKLLNDSVNPHDSNSAVQD